MSRLNCYRNYMGVINPKRAKDSIFFMPILWCDNTSSITLASNPIFQFCTKYIELDYHYVREKVSRN